jgi:hypothetical protein
LLYAVIKFSLQIIRQKRGKRLIGSGIETAHSIKRQIAMDEIIFPLEPMDEVRCSLSEFAFEMELENSFFSPALEGRFCYDDSMHSTF